MTKQSESEKKVAAASYFYDFYKEVISLNHHEAQYQNVIVEIEYKHGAKLSADGLDDGFRTALIEQVQLVRYFCRKAWIMYNSLRPILCLAKDDDNKQIVDEAVEELNRSYENMKSQYILDRADLETYTVALNKILLGNVIKSLIDSSNDIIEGIYSNTDS